MTGNRADVLDESLVTRGSIDEKLRLVSGDTMTGVVD